MKDPNIKTEVRHSLSKTAWNVVGTKLGGKQKIARVPYIPSQDAETDARNRTEAYQHAVFISYCFNHSAAIIEDRRTLSPTKPSQS